MAKKIISKKIIEKIALILGVVLTLVTVITIPLVSYNNYKDYLEEIKEQADIQLQWEEDFLKAKAEWEAAHPGEKYMVDGGMPPVQSISVSIGEIDNINNIREYLGMEMGEIVSTSSDENNASSYSYLIIPAAVVAVALVIAVAVIVLKKKKKAKASDRSEQELLP